MTRMANLLQNKRLVIVAMGAGMVVGGGIVWFMTGRHLSFQIQCLSNQMTLLQQEVNRLRSLLVEQLSRTRNKIENIPPVTSKPVASSEDEDEVYEEAYDGDEYQTENGLSSPLDFSRVDQLFEGNENDKREAFQILQKHKDSQTSRNDVNFIWRLAKATYFMSQFEAQYDKERQKQLIYRAKDLAAAAIEQDDDSSNAHKWYAICLGSTNDYESIKVKIQNGYQFRKHIERAIELNPSDPTGHYLLGRWCYGVYLLSWVERKMAATLFSTPPTATIDEALSNFLQADKLNPGKWKENLLFIGKCFVEKCDYQNAVTWLEKANDLPNLGHDDVVYQSEVEQLLNKYKTY